MSFFLLYAEVIGILPPPELSVTVTQGVGLAVGAVMTIVLLNLATRSIDMSLARAHIELAERERAQNALRASEERYRFISTVSSDYMFSSHPDKNDRVTLNWAAGAFHTITGYINGTFTGYQHHFDVWLESIMAGQRDPLAEIHNSRCPCARNR